MTRLLPALGTAALVALVALAAPAAAKGPAGCPPGLAKKDPACVPPGLAKKGVTTEDILSRGDRFDRDGERIWYPNRYRLPRLDENEGYYRDGRIVYRVDEDTRRVIEIFRLSAELFAN